MVSNWCFVTGNVGSSSLPRFTIGFLDNRPRPKLSVAGNFASNCVPELSDLGIDFEVGSQ